MKIGYARVSSEDQSLDLQLDALRKADCKRIFQDKCSGAGVDRPGLNDLLKTMREGDVIIVWRLDRLGRSLKDLLTLAERFEKEGVGLSSIVTLRIIWQTLWRIIWQKLANYLALFSYQPVKALSWQHQGHLE